MDAVYEERDRRHNYERQWGYVNPCAAAFWRLRDELVFSALSDRFDTLIQSISVLEVGAGHGHELAKLSQLGIPQSHLVGVDIAPTRIQRARTLYPGITFEQSDARQLNFADASFDVVCQFTCVMHAATRDDQQLMCDEMKRVLRPKGVIVWWDIAPMRLSTAWLKKGIGANPAPGFREIAASMITDFQRLTKSTHVHPQSSNFDRLDIYGAHALPVSVPRVQVLLKDLAVTAQYAGLDYGVWERLWPKYLSLAERLWRRGWFGQHCFATADKA
jgi:ubiquinone/menaquinone biosynthesis C-methylase UbiE